MRPMSRAIPAGGPAGDRHRGIDQIAPWNNWTITVAMARLETGPVAWHGDSGPGLGTSVDQSKSWPKRSPGSIQPRRVHNGVRLRLDTGQISANWAGGPWLGILESLASVRDLEHGIEYAQRGQAIELSIDPGRITARVQGLASRPCRVVVETRTLSPEQWIEVIAQMGSAAVHAARAIAGELSERFIEQLESRGLRLMPDPAGDLEPNCSCAVSDRWCPHVCCVLLLVAQRLAQDPWDLLRLRGMDREELVQRLREGRAAATSVHAEVPVYTPHLEGANDPVLPLEPDPAAFWRRAEGLERIDLPIEPPEVSHPLLRRLGPSPFPNARFPLVGLLATCYELFTRDATAQDGEDTLEDEETGGQDPVPGE